MKKITVQVPATSANCGPGFDCLGIALSLYNRFSYEKRPTSEGITISYEGLGKEYLEQEPLEDSLLLTSVVHLFNKKGEALPSGHFQVTTEIPPSRGLGSSATAIVGGLYIANALLGDVYSKEELLKEATLLEGHPDNVCPAIFGSLCLSTIISEAVEYSIINVPKEIALVTVVPELLLSTKEARAVLPQEVSYGDALQNVARVSFFMTAMMQNRADLLSFALEDRLHVPYRLPLIKGAKEAIAASLEGGAYGGTISGAGSTLIAYCPADKVITENVAQKMVQVFQNEKVDAKAYFLSVDTDGAMYL